MRKTKEYKLPPDTIIEVVAMKDGQTVKKEMTYGNALELLKKRNGWDYKLFQRGFSSFNELKKSKQYA